MLHVTQDSRQSSGPVPTSHKQRPYRHLTNSVIPLMLVLLAPVRLPAMASDQHAPGSLKSLSIEELMNIEVTSVSKHPEKLAETASAIQVITHQDIQRSGATRLPEVLRLASNLQVAQKNAHDWGISARGFNTELANKLLVLIDGRSVYTPLYSGVFWDAQDYLLEDIERIEVISGPGGTLWGANAVNGVINIITRSAGETQGLHVEAGAGSELQNLAGIRYGGTVAPDLAFRVYGKHFERDGSVLSTGDTLTDDWRMNKTGFRMDAEPSVQDLLTLQGDYYSGVENLATGGSTALSGINLLGRWSHSHSDGSSMNLQAYYDHTHLSLPKPTNGFVPAGVLTDNLDTYDLDFQYHFYPRPRHQMTWGVAYRFTHDAIDNAPSLVFLPNRQDHSLYSGFIQDQITLREDLFLTMGTKLEHNDYTGFEYEPSGRLQWNYSRQQLLWAAISRAVRTPSRIDRDLQEPTGLPAPFPQSILNGGADFVSETVVAYEAGHRAQLGQQLVTSIATFYNDYDHVRSTTPGVAGFPTFGFPLVFANNLQGETYGLELSVTYQPVRTWRLRAGYNLLKEHLRVQAGKLDFSNARNETSDPEQQLSLHSSLDLSNHLLFDLSLRWVDTLHNNDGPNAGTVPSYAEADLRLAWQPHESLELSITGQNLLHGHHPEYGFPASSRAEIPRNFVGKAVWNF